MAHTEEEAPVHGSCRRRRLPCVGHAPPAAERRPWPQHSGRTSRPQRTRTVARRLAACERASPWASMTAASMTAAPITFR